MIDWIKKIVLNKYVGMFLRQGLAMLGGVLVTMGVSEEVSKELVNELSVIIINGSPTWIALAWSYFDKKKNQIDKK